MLRRTLLLVFCLVMAFLFAGCDKLSVKKGDSFTRLIKITSIYNMSIFNNVEEKTSEMILDCKVVDIDNQGNAIVKATINKIEAKIATMGVLIQFSTDDPEINTKENSRPEMQKKYVEYFKPLVGKSYLAVIDNNGKVKELRDVDPAIAKYVNAVPDVNINGYNQIVMLLADHMLREYISPGIYNGLPIDDSNGEKTSEAVVTVPSLNAITVTRKLVEPGKMAESTSSWPADTVKRYYSISADGLPVKLSTADETPAKPDDKYRSATHTAIAVFGNGCVGYSPTGKFVKMVERNIVELSSNRLTERTDSRNRRRVQMYYIVDKTIENM